MTIPETHKTQIEIGGKTVTIETGKYAQSTNGSVKNLELVSTFSHY